jgi:YD repeat-containing protein
VPAGATTGPVTVTTGGGGNTCPGGNCGFTVIPPPQLTSLSPAIAPTGTAITIAGANFLSTQGSSTVTFNGVVASVSSWSDTSVTAAVPATASSGHVVVTVSSQASNGLAFTVLGTISGTVTRFSGGTPIAGAAIEARLAGVLKGSASTAANGTYTIPDLPPGTYEIRAAATGFSNELLQGIVLNSPTATANVTMYAPGSINGTVTQADGTTPIAGAAVAVYLGPNQRGSTHTNASGGYAITGLHPGSYTVQAASVGYRTGEQGALISDNAATTKDFALQVMPSGPVLYAYDPLDRLVQVTDSAGDSAIYRYDSVGNLLAIERHGSTGVAVSGFSPAKGHVGTVVTVFGSGFSETANQNTLTFNGTAATITTASPTQLTATVPAGASSGSLAVTTPTGSATSPGSFTVSAASGAPTISGFTPAIWAGTGSLTINGTNFDPTPANDRINLNIAFATASNASASQLLVLVPATATSGRITVETMFGRATTTADFFVPPPTYLAANAVATGRTTVGSSVPVSFPVTGKYALYVFDPPAGRKVSATVSNSTLAGGNIFFYYPNGAVAASRSFGTATAFVDAFPSGDGATYTMLVATAATHTGNATVTLHDVPLDASATIAANGASQALTTTAPGQNGLLTFSGTAGQRVSLTVTGGTFSGCTHVVIIRPYPDENWVKSNACVQGSAYFETETLPASGLYRIVMDPPGTETGSMTFALHEDVTNTIEAGGPAVTTTITRAGQNGLLTFPGTAGQRVSLVVSNVAISACTAVSIVRPTPTPVVLASWWCFTNDGMLDTVTLPATETYHVVVNPEGAGVGSIATRLYDVPADQTGPIVVDGPSVGVSITTPGQNAVFTFAGSSGQSVRLTVSGTTITACTDVSIRHPAPNETNLASWWCFGNGVLDATLPAAGDYRVVVNPSAAGIGTMTLALTDTSGGLVEGSVPAPLHGRPPSPSPPRRALNGDRDARDGSARSATVGSVR